MNTDHPIFNILEQAAIPMNTDEKALFKVRWNNYDVRQAIQKAVISSVDSSV